MTCQSFWRSTEHASIFQIFAAPIRITGVVLFMLLLVRGASAVASDTKKSGTVPACAFSDAEFDAATDVHALDEYRDAIAQLLKQERLADIERVANAAQVGKTRFAGGAWKLRNVFEGLDSPRPGHPTQDDWQQHMALLERWEKQDPRSLTVRIALAESYVSYAWDARGTGVSDSVSDSGWKLFGERIAQARSILDGIAATDRKSPDWFVAMQLVAQGQSWDLPEETALFQQAIALEPGYQYYYRVFANYLLPQWHGEDRDASRFAEEAANRRGGDAGDLLYFQIAEGNICACEDPEFAHFSWPRLQKGFAVLEKQYGPSLLVVNSFALMASKSGDWIAADPAFKRIGDNWDKDVWRTEAWFKSNRTIAAQVAPSQLRARAFRQKAEANMKSPDGQAYRVNFDPKFAAYERSCSNDKNADPSKFDLLVQVGANGSVEESHTEKQPTAFAMCIMRALYASYVGKETPFPPHPKARTR
jgi:hypothetical protein